MILDGIDRAEGCWWLQGLSRRRPQPTEQAGNCSRARVKEAKVEAPAGKRHASQITGPAAQIKPQLPRRLLLLRPWLESVCNGLAAGLGVLHRIVPA